MAIKCSGSLGDTFIILIKIMGSKVKKIYHYSQHPSIFPKIKEIYSLLGDVEVTTQKLSISHPNRKGSIKGHIKNKEHYTPFPTFILPPINEFKLPIKYNVLQLQSGIKKNSKTRSLNKKELKKIDNTLPVVLIGTDNKKINKNFIDLRNKTTLLESFNIIKNCNEFYGPQGLLSFFALSQEKISHIFVKSGSDRHAVNTRINKIKEWKKNVRYYGN